MSKFIGLVSAYAYAKSKGYTGTEEEFAILMAEYASVTETAVEAVRIATESAQSAAAASSDVNRAAATVTQQAAQVHNDAETSSESAATASEAKETAADKALDSEAYALGTRDGEDVGSSDPAYHNNAKYYAQQGSASAQTATEAAQTATTKASEAQASASAAAESARTLTIDATLTQSGQAADAKKTGEKISAAVSETEVWLDVALDIQRDGYYNTNGHFVSDFSRQYAIVPVSAGEQYKLTTKIRSALLPAVLYFNGDTFISYEKNGSGTNEFLVDYPITIPNGCDKLIVQCADPDDILSLKKYAIQYEFNAYTKAETDSKLTAVSKQFGDEITGLKEDVAVAVNITPNWESVSLTLQNGYYYKDTGEYYEASDSRSAKINVTVGSKYKLSTYTRSAVISGIMFFDSDDVVVGTLLDGTGTGVVIANYEFTIPVGVASMAVQSNDAEQAIPILYVYEEEKEFVGYTKTEVDEKISTIPKPKKYGVKWEISNPDDLGQRCFDAIGLTASIGIGSTNGQSDFDNVYPWSEIRRCNIKQNANGAKIITYEGESGFALDGSNGDVFVRIPKFYYERYRKDGYEYRVISASGVNPHPVFVEGNKVLDEIFVGAFEGGISSSKLRSIGGVIPSSNETAQTFLDAARANGDGYTIYDMRTVNAVWTLMAVEFGCRNTNQIIGYGFADFLQPAEGTYSVECDTAGTTNTFSASKSIPAARIALMPVGSNCTICKESQFNVIASRRITEITSDANHWYISFDGDPIELDATCFIGAAGCTTNFCETAPSGALTWHTGRANWISGSNTKNPVRYRWMENLVGSLWHLLPDVIFKDLQMYVCNDIARYAIDATSSEYTPIGDLLLEQTSNGDRSDVPDANYWITDLNDFSFGKSYDFGKTWDMSLLSTQAFGAFYYLGSGTKIIANGGGFDHLYRCNMLTQRAWIRPSDKWYLYGARLLYKHLT